MSRGELLMAAELGESPDVVSRQSELLESPHKPALRLTQRTPTSCCGDLRTRQLCICGQFWKAPH